MQDVSQLFEVVGIITSFLPVIVVLALVGFFVRQLLNMIGAKGKLAKQFDKMLIISVLSVFLFAVAPASGGMAAVSLAVESGVVLDATIITLVAKGLTINTEYTIWNDHSAAIDNVTITASRSSHSFPIGMPAEADRKFSFFIAPSTTGANTSAYVATVFLSLTDGGSFLPTDIFFNLMVPIILIVIIAGIAIALIKGFSGAANEGTGGGL